MKASAMKVDLPGGEWAELKDVDALTGADQDAYYDAYDAIMAAKPQPESRPDPENPAVMLEPARPRMTIADNRVMRDAVLGIAVTAWSLSEGLPFTAETRRRLPVRVVNALNDAIGPLDSALAGNEDVDPKSPEPSPGSGGSSGTSRESTGSPLPVPPAALSAMP